MLVANKCIVLLSGGLDSTTVLALAKSEGYEIVALTFRYGQRHLDEINKAVEIARYYQCLDHKIIDIPLSAYGHSALTDHQLKVPEKGLHQGIPITYVPARNLIFLSLAVGWAEALEVQDIFIGVNAIDYSGYPDCRSVFIDSFQETANLGTKNGINGKEIKIHTPLITLSKAEIILKGTGLGVDYQKTVSCYQLDNKGKACGLCDSCRFRMAGFEQAGINDPTIYKS
jgi:7-cyano-7-deazaguanine synthase